MLRYGNENCQAWGRHFHLIPNDMQNKKVQLIEKINKNLIYFDVNCVPIIHYEHIFIIYTLYFIIHVIIS